MRNILLSAVVIFILISQLDTGEYWLGTAVIILVINFILQVKKEFDFKL